MQKIAKAGGGIRNGNKGNPKQVSNDKPKKNPLRTEERRLL